MTRETFWWVVRRIGAGSLLVVGGVHLWEYMNGYAEIETIGALFLLNFVAATLLAVGLLLPTERLLPRRRGWLVPMLALGGVGLSASSLTMLMIAERRPLFGFMEPGFHPEMIQLSRVSEVVTVVLLGALLLARPIRGRAHSGLHIRKGQTDERLKGAHTHG